jgi:hypothetical protein
MQLSARTTVIRGITSKELGVRVFRVSHRRLLALAVLIAIAAVLISPAVPSAPTLLPVSALLLAGVIVIASHADMRRDRPVIAVFSYAQPISPAVGLEFVTAGLPLRR